MSKRNKHKKHQHQASPGSVPQATAGPQPGHEASPSEKIERLTAAASAGATKADHLAVQAQPDQGQGLTLDELIKKGREALSLLEAQRKRLEHEEGAVQQQTAKLKSERDDVAAERENLNRRAEELSGQAAALSKKEAGVRSLEQDLLKRQEDVARRELDADSGFAQRNREALDSLEKEALVLREELYGHRARMASEQQKWEEDQRRRLEELNGELERRRIEQEAALERDRARATGEMESRAKGLDDREAEARAEAERLRQEARSIETGKEILAEDQQAFRDKVKQHAAAEIERREAAITALEERLAAASEKRDELQRLIVENEETERQLGDQRNALDELRQLRKERDQLKRELGGRLDVKAAQRLEELERRREEWDVEQARLLAEVSALRQDVIHKRIAVTELESLRDQKDALEASNALLARTLDEEVRKVQDQIRSADGDKPFPSCSAMDSADELQNALPLTDKIASLREFADRVRHRMAFDPLTKKQLYYSIPDVRCFIAGLAMSRLHILQGISGTGKTSLPQAFARAIGTGQALIEVQAGWRDRQDLIGHFNVFEKHFVESEFLLALYKASCPRYKDAPFIVVLDEMNLSYVEQYFADLLSALEQAPDKQRLVLMSASVGSAPELLVEGRILPLPQNVWFVGTANHDETTKDFADKTYDRAHVMELPRLREHFTPDKTPLEAPYSLEALQNAFDKAAKTHAVKAKASYDFLDEHIAETLDERFRVGWGNRLELQMSKFVPVVIECGGSIGEATDHILATKLLRKIRNRHDNTVEDVTELREVVRTAWQDHDKTAGPVKSMAILEEELRRLGHKED